MGDMNINYLKWQKNDSEMSNQTRKLRPLIEELFIRIIPYGFAQMVKVATHYWPGQMSTGLDHFYTNMPNKIQEIQNFCWGGSDHELLVATRRAKSIVSKPSYVRKRSYKCFAQSQFLSAVNNINWLSVYLCDDVNKAVEAFTQKLIKVMDVMCPLKTFQMRTRLNGRLEIFLSRALNFVHFY